ncbi:MAG: hypothetical protein SOR77_09830 [Peptoniphilus sp.]|uniref:hypothetical protein n=1 Tax=Peptoniphilus sp. TaxID=1971214 RepID=UPI002A754E1B|nr:hypothetical protein [Peptoniphilus sp.]MDY2987919.1 hypothetical protein [Peptoniphilus sp.]
MIHKIVIKNRLPGMNEVINKNRVNKFAGARLKKETTEMIAWNIKAQMNGKIKNQIDITFKWHCKDKRRDKDNIMSAQKFIFDGLQMAGIIKNDGWNEVRNISHKFLISGTEMVEIYMQEV